MGNRCQCCQTPDVDEQAVASSNLDADLIQRQIEENFKFKILLLGAGESGKSTVVKQLKLIHKKKITKGEWKLTATSLHQNVIDCFKAIFNAVKVFEEKMSPECQEVANRLLSWNETEPLTPQIGRDLQDIVWKDEAIQRVYAQRSQYWLLDSFEYYLKHLDRFCSPTFEPVEEDAVMVRIRTTGIVVTDLEQRINNQDPNEPEFLKFQVVDVGGQRNERKKWMHCFDDVKAILFCVNLAGYNQVLFEDNNKNRMIEALELFKKVVCNPVFEDTPIFLFLNKKDLFEKWLDEQDMKKVFPKYTGGNHVHSALDFIKDEFKDLLPPKKNLTYQVVSARFKPEIRAAFQEVKKQLYDDNKKEMLSKVVKLKRDLRAIERSKKKSACGCCPCLPC